MRFVAAAAFLAAMSCSAQASSFVIVEDTAPEAAPSIEVVGSDAVESSSILALGPPSAPEKTVEVARVEETPPPRTTYFNSMPFVIRAGIEGDPVARASASAAAVPAVAKQKVSLPWPYSTLDEGGSKNEKQAEPKSDPQNSRRKLR